MAATLTISASEVNTLIASPSTFTGYSSTKNIVINGDITYTQARALSGVASPSITASVTQTSISNLKTITPLSGRTNAFTLTVNDITASAADLNAVKALTTVAPNFGSVGTVTGLAADIKILYTGNTNTTLGNEAISVSDTTAVAADLNTINGFTSGLVSTTATSLIGKAADFNTIHTNRGTTGDKINQAVLALPIEVNDAVINAGVVNTVNNNYTGVVTLSSGSSVIGTMAELGTLNTADNTSGVTNELDGFDGKAVEIKDGANKFTTADVNTVYGYTSGPVTAVLSDDEVVLLNALNGTGHTLTATIVEQTDTGGADTVVLAADLKALMDKLTSSSKINIGDAVTVVKGSTADVTAVYGSDIFTFVGDEAITLTDNASVSAVNNLIQKTTGAVTATLSDNTFTALEGLTLNSASGATKPALAITVADSNIDATKANALLDKTTGAVTFNAISVTGTLDAVNTLYTTDQAGDIGLSDEAVTISDTGELDGTKLDYVNGRTSGLITVSGTSIKGTVTELKAIYNASGTSGDKIAGLGNESLLITDADVPAADVKTLDAATTGLVGFASTALEISGSLTDVEDVIDAAIGDPTANPVVPPTVSPDALSKIHDISDALLLAKVVELDGKLASDGVIDAALTDIAAHKELDNILHPTTGLPAGHKIAFQVDTDSSSTTNGASEIDADNLAKAIALTTGTVTLKDAQFNITGSGADLAAIYSASNTANIKGSAETLLVTGTTVSADDIVVFSQKVRANAVGGVGGNGTTGNVIIGKSDTAVNLVGSSVAIEEVLKDYANGVNATGAGGFIFAAADGTTAKNPTVTVTGVTANAAKVHTFMDYDVDAGITVASQKLSGGKTDILALYTAGDVVGLDAIDFVYSGTAADLAAIVAKTTGNISGTVSDGTTTLLLASLPTNKVLDVKATITSATVNATDLLAVTARTNGLITLDTPVVNISGTAADIESVINASAAGTSITGLANNVSVSLSGGATSVAKLNTISGFTTGTVSGTITDSIDSLMGITETTNTLTLIVNDTVVDAAKLITLDAKFTEAINFSDSVTTLSGTRADITTVLGAAGIDSATSGDGLGTKAVTVTESITKDQLNALDDITTGAITATISDTTLDKLKLITDDNSNNILSITVTGNTATDSKVLADDIETVNGKTAGMITIDSSVTKMTGDMDHVTNVVNANDTTPNISGLSNLAVEITSAADGTTTANTIAAINNVIAKAGVVTATVYKNGNDQKLDKILDATNGLQGTGNAISIHVDSDVSGTAATKANAAILNAASLTALNSKTTGLITVTSNITSIQGTAAEVAAVYDAFDATAVAGTQITGLASNLPVTIIDAPSGTPAVGGVVQAADLVKLVAATDGTTGAITLSGAASISGTFADIKTIVVTKSSQFTGEHADDVTITDSITAAQAKEISEYVETGTNVAYGAHVTATISDTEMSKFDTLTEVDDHVFTINIKDASVDAVKLATLNTKTKGVITVDSATVTGLIGGIEDIYDTDKTGLAGLGDEAINVTGNVTVAQANALSGYSTGIATASLAKAALSSFDGLITSTDAYSMEIDDTSVSASALAALDAKTSGTVTVTDLATITGFLTDVKAVYDSKGISGLGNEAVTISDTGSVSASDLYHVNTLTSGLLRADGVTSISGSVADLLRVYNGTAGVIAGLGDESISITDTGTVAAADINTLNGLTSGSVTATGVTKLTGTVTEINAARSGATVTGVTSLALDGSTETFNATSYLASNADLIKAFGNSPASAVTHYLTFGVNESRNLDSFDEKSYLASHADLLTAFGSDTAKATNHYISNGFSENRALDTFDEFGYVASYSDLITALGADATAAVDHYINFGYGEKRSSTFNASSYLSVNADLQAAFGSDLEAAKKHYINHGASENRLLA